MSFRQLVTLRTRAQRKLRPVNASLSREEDACLGGNGNTDLLPASEGYVWAIRASRDNAVATDEVQNDMPEGTECHDIGDCLEVTNRGSGKLLAGL